MNVTPSAASFFRGMALPCLGERITTNQGLKTGVNEGIDIIPAFGMHLLAGYALGFVRVG